MTYKYNSVSAQLLTGDDSYRLLIIVNVKTMQWWNEKLNLRVVVKFNLSVYGFFTKEV